jgi:putative peptidoglycan lipid II flippase
VRAFYAMHDTRTPVAIGIGAMGLNVCLSLAFLAAFESAGRPPYGGLALANSLATTAEMGALLGLLRRRLGGLEGHRLGSSLARVAPATAAMAAVLLAVGWALAGAGAWLQAGVGIAAGVATYGGISLALGATEPQAMIRAMRAGRR